VWKEKVKDDCGKGKWKEVVKEILKEDSERESGIGTTPLLSIYYMNGGPKSHAPTNATG
jgi:hypothetical protein